MRPYQHVLLLKPYKALIAGVIAYLVLFILAPIHISVDYTLEGPIFLVLVCTAFLMGDGFGRYILEPFGRRSASGSNSLRAPTDPVYSHGLLRFFLIVAWISEIAWLIDRFYFRGYSIDADAVEQRELTEGSESGPLSVLAAITSPASYLAWYVLLARQLYTRVGLGLRLLSFITYWFPSINSLFVASRSVLLLSLLLMLLLNFYFRTRTIKLSTLISLGALFVGVLVFFVQTILYRLSLVGLSPLFSITNSVYAFTLQPNDNLVMELSKSPDGFYAAMLFAASNVAQYYCHGVFELFYQIDNFHGLSHTYGSNTFFVPYKFLAIFLPLPNPLEMLAAARPHYGAFGTFFGPLHSDFGWFAVIASFGFGIVAWAFHRLARRNASWVPLYAFIVVTIFFFPVVNTLVAGTGFYLLTGFVLFGLFVKTKKPLKGPMPVISNFRNGAVL